MVEPRLFVAAPLGAGAHLALDADQAGYLTRVLRRGVGDGVRVFNGVDGEWRALLETAGKRGATLVCEAPLRAQTTTPDLWLLFAPVKRQATDWIVEKATELGAARLLPTITRRTVAETVRVERLAAIAREAAEQTERLDLPAIDPAQPLARVLDGWDRGRPLVFADEAGEGAPPLLEALTGLTSAKLALLTGPEGGFDPDERRLLRALPFVVPVSLGPRILRAETAVAAGLALIQAGWGDWRALALQG